MPTRVTAVRALLLTLVAVGVVGMHSLGHPRDGRLPASHLALVSGHHPETAGPAATGLEVPPHRPGHDLDPAAICLAILTAASVALGGMAWAMHRHLMPGRGRLAANTLAGLGRAPPRGRMLAELSVLRI